MQSRKKLTFRLLPTFLVLIAMLLAACGGGGSTNTPGSTQKASADKQVLNYPAEVTDIGTFDPAQASDIPSAIAIDMVFTGMVQLDSKLNVVPQLASSWDQSSDHLTWTFHLKPNLKFSDGTPLTSQDVVYSMDRALQPALKSPVAYYLALIKDSDKLQAGKIKTIIGDSLLTPDANTVVIKTSQPAAYFLYTLTYPTSFVVEKKLVDSKTLKLNSDSLNTGGGDGPFMVQQYSHTKGITLVPNPNYYGQKPQLQKFFYAFGEVLTTTYKDYQVGQLDYTPVPTAELASAKLKTQEYHQVGELTIDYLGLNYLAKPFDNIHIRQAFDLALNKDAIMQTAYKGTRPATNHIIPTGMPGTNPNITAPDGKASTSGNPTQAQALLKKGLQEEGWSSVAQMTPVTLTYPTGSVNYDNEIAAIIQNWQSVLGVSVKPAPLSFEKIVTAEDATLNNPKGLQMWGIAWIADYPDPQDWTTLLFGKGSTYNLSNFGSNTTYPAVATRQQALQQQMTQADFNQNSATRYQAYQSIEQQLVNDVAWLTMDQRTSTRLIKPYVIGLQDNAALYYPPDSWHNVYIATH